MPWQLTATSWAWPGWASSQEQCVQTWFSFPLTHLNTLVTSDNVKNQSENPIVTWPWGLAHHYTPVRKGAGSFPLSQFETISSKVYSLSTGGRQGSGDTTMSHTLDQWVTPPAAYGRFGRLLILFFVPITFKASTWKAEAGGWHVWS